MKSIQIKNKLNISILNEKLKKAEQIKIQSSWKLSNIKKENNDLSKNLQFQEELKKQKDPLKKKEQSFSIELSQKIVKFNKKKGAIPFSSDNIIGLLTLNSFENKEDLFNSINKVNSKKVSFWFLQLKSFFFKMPSDVVDNWFIKSSEIQHLINLNYLNTWNITSVVQKFLK